jgi:magnesium-transporting ATPase (P-type)
MEERKNTIFLTELLRRFSVIFSLAIVAISVMGFIVGRYSSEARDFSALFVPGKDGLTFNAVFQIVCLSLVMSVFSLLLFSDFVQIKMRFFFRGLLLLLATLAASSVFAAVFKWLPNSDPLSWLCFILATIFCFAVSFMLTLLKLKLEGKKYDKLLANYKKQHGLHGD